MYDDKQPKQKLFKEEEFSAASYTGKEDALHEVMQALFVGRAHASQLYALGNSKMVTDEAKLMLTALYKGILEQEKAILAIIPKGKLAQITRVLESDEYLNASSVINLMCSHTSKVADFSEAIVDTFETLYRGQRFKPVDVNKYRVLFKFLREEILADTTDGGIPLVSVVNNSINFTLQTPERGTTTKNENKTAIRTAPREYRPSTKPYRKPTSSSRVPTGIPHR